jgi:glucose-6-phosphate 1-epimerase
MSGRSWFEAGRPIRGGVPICFPWFGPNPKDPKAPAHGIARTQPWELNGVTAEPDGTIVVRLSLASGESSRAFDAGDFSLDYTVRFGSRLGLALTVINTGSSALTFDEALHTYLTVGDARRVSVDGLAGAEYYDKTDGMTRKRQANDPIVITAETDRLYLDTLATVTVDDPVLARRIVVSKTGSRSTVLWNPWVAKSAAMPDFGDDEWAGMMCVETVNAADNAVTIAPGERHTMTAAVSVEQT